MGGKVMKVRANSVYTFRRAGWDLLLRDASVNLQDGEKVRVVNLPGCCPCNTMGHAHVERLDGSFAGLVATASLVKE